MSSQTPFQPVQSPPEAATQAKVAIFVVAEDAVAHLSACLDRIPAHVREAVDEIFICDAASQDDTYLLSVGYAAASGFENFSVVRGSGGGAGASHKNAIEHCRARGFDIVVILHADGKYAPEAIEDLMAPLAGGEVDAVFGSRFLEERPVKRGIPLYKYWVMRALDAIQRRLFGLGLSDHHCGYRAYSVRAITELPFALNSDDLVFDTEIIGQLKQKGLRVTEVPVPAYTGEETRGLRGVHYTAQVLRVLVQYWLHTKGIREYPKFAIAEKYAYKDSPDASHARILSMVDKDRQEILDLGCGAGFLAEALAVRGNRVIGVDVRRAEGVESRVARFMQVDLDRDPILWTGERFPFIVLADVLEHLREPGSLLEQCRDLLADDGRLIVSVPNVAHWSVRLPLLFGRFVYAGRGILDRTHLRFFTLRSIRDALERGGFVVEGIEATTAPFEQMFPGRLGALLSGPQRLGIRFWKELFAYQFILCVRKRLG